MPLTSAFTSPWPGLTTSPSRLSSLPGEDPFGALPEEDAEFVSEEALRAAWGRAGRPPDSFSETAALSLLLAEEDPDEMQGFVDVASERGQKLLASLRGSGSEGVESPSPPSSRRGKAVGIDLGTTFSSVAVVEGGVPVVIPVDDCPLVPSVVAYLSEERLLVGERARRQRVVNPKNTFSSVKRIIGSSVKQVKERGEKLSLLKVDSSSRETCLLKSTALNRLLRPEDVSAEVLRYLLQQATKYLGSPVERAVITVPAYFSPTQCRATENAGKLAGLEKVKLLREPEAAALAYGLNRKEPQVILVFDLGGGTLDVSVLDVGGGLVEVKATSGDPHLGGDDFDTLIVRWLIAQHVANGGKDPIGNAFLMSRLYDIAESAKKDLSSQTSTIISVPLLDGEKSLEVELTRRKFESLASKLITRMLKPIREVAIMSGVNLMGESGQAGVQDDDDDSGDGDVEVSSAALRKSQLEGRKAAREKRKLRGTVMKETRRLQKEFSDPSISTFPGGRILDDVILVGGATRMPCIQRLLRTVTGIEPKSSVNPDEAVSLGAAVLAGIMDGEIKNMEVMSAWQAAMYKAFYEQQLEREKNQKKSNEVSSLKEDSLNKSAVIEAKYSVLAEAPKKKSSLLQNLLQKRKSISR